MAEASVVIATRDRAEMLTDCLASLARQSARGRFEIVVVDNGSGDSTPNVIERFGNDGVRGVYEAHPNRSKARNTGIAQAHGDLVIFIDDDTIAPPDFIAAHLRAHQITRSSVVCGPIVNVPDGDHLIPPAPRHYSGAYFCTCNVSVVRTELAAIGGFDERYDLYGWEDTDLGIRLRTRGLRRTFSWAAFIYHIKPPQAMTLERRRALAIEKGTMAARFVRKMPSWPVKLATGAYTANFLRAGIVNAPFLRRLYERTARSAMRGSALEAFANEALVDAAYVDALQSALRATNVR